MGLFRLLTYIVIIWLIWSIIKRTFSTEKPQPRQRQISRKMVRCSYCQVHLPEQDAIRQDDDWFCSQAHRQAFLKDR